MPSRMQAARAGRLTTGMSTAAPDGESWNPVCRPAVEPRPKNRLQNRPRATMTPPVMIRRRGLAGRSRTSWTMTASSSGDVVVLIRSTPSPAG